LEAAVREELARATTQFPVAARPPDRISHEARRVALERALERMLERRGAGQWTDAELVRRAAPNVLEQLEIEIAEAAAREEAIEPEDARTRLVEEWDTLPFERRRA